LPTPAKTSRTELVGIARWLVERDGADAVTLSAVATLAGVKAPSLYKHFADRAALMKAVEIEVLLELEAALRMGISGRTPRQRLASMARAYRTFAVSQPHRYAIVFTGNAASDPEIAAACLFAVQPLFEELRGAGVKPGRVLPLARALTAFLHGFVSMELADAFQLGGSIDEAFTEGVAIVVAELKQ
jgi:AcrR family transcriptional regulator